jgi:hypothetical protein
VEPEQSPFAEREASDDASAPQEGSAAARKAPRPPAAGSVLSVFVSPRRLALLVAAGLAASTLASWLAVGVELAHARQLYLRHTGAAVDGSQIALVEVTLRVALGLKLAAFALTAAVFLAWLHRLRVNLRALGMRRLVFARHWSWLGFLVPVLNFVRPYQVMAEVWTASDPSVLDPFEWKSIEPPRMLARWWAACVVALTLELTAYGFSLSTQGVAFKALVASVAAIAAGVAIAVCASLAYFVVLRMTDAQLAKRDLLRGESEPS